MLLENSRLENKRNMQNEEVGEENQKETRTTKFDKTFSEGRRRQNKNN